MSRPELAGRLGVHESMLYRQERAKAVDSLYRLACAAIGAEQGLPLGAWGEPHRKVKRRRS
jgi:hypothetical protein